MTRRPGRCLVGAMAVGMLAGGAAPVGAQDTTAALSAPAVRWIGLSGSLTAMGELYGREGAGEPARPDRTGRVTANLTVSLFNGLVSMPLTAIVSTDQVSFRQQINQFGVSPTYRGVTLHMGHFAPQYSRYTLADQTVLGGGFDVARSGFRLGALSGRARRAVMPDTSSFPPVGQPQFERRLTAARLGYGDPQRSFLDVFLVQAEDDALSLDSTALANYVLGSSVVLSAERNTVIGARGQVALAGQRATLEVEGATSRHALVDVVGATETEGKAGAARLRVRAGRVTLGGNVEYVEAGFVTHGNAGLSPDRLDYGATLAGQLFRGRVAFNAMGGWRQNNLADELAATTKRAIYSVAGTLQPAPVFGVDFQAANNVNDSRNTLDPASSVKNVTAQYSVTPRLLWRTGPAQHVLVLFASRQESENTSPGTTLLTDTRTTNLVGTWAMTFPSGIGLTATATRTEVELDSLTTMITTLAPGVNLAVVRRRLQLSLQAQLLHLESPSLETDEVFPAVQVRYAVAPGHQLQLKTTLRHHTLSTGDEFTERVATLGYSASWR